MYAGYVLKRNAPISPPPMQKVYSVLFGTLLMDFDSEEDAQASMTPRTCVEILGVSEWDGKGRANSYPFGFLLVTHTGGTYYVSVSTRKERDDWVLNLKRALECVFANPEVAPFKPSKILSNRPPLSNFYHCARTGNALHRSNVSYCKACGRAFCSSEYVNDSCSMLQIGAEELEKVCEDCRNAQAVILWFKSLNYVHAMTLHELTPVVLQDIRRFKASFRWRRSLSARLDSAALLLGDGSITAAEFEELRQVDHAYRRELLHEESTRLKIAIDAFGDDMQTIIDILLNSSLVDKGGRSSYYNVILKILDIADHAPDLIDFFFPQLLQVHLCIAAVRSERALIKVDLLQQALLVMSQKYPPLGLKLAWGLLATVGDFAEGKCSQVQYAASVALLLQLEMIITGGFVSCITDVPACRLLANVLRASGHQQQELGFEIGALFLVRRRLQEVFDEEEKERQLRTRDGPLNKQLREVRARLSSSSGDGAAAAVLAEVVGGDNTATAAATGSSKEITGPVHGVDNLILAVAAASAAAAEETLQNSDMSSTKAGYKYDAATAAAVDPSTIGNATTAAATGTAAVEDVEGAEEDEWSCVEMLNHLGVGQANRRKTRKIAGFRRRAVDDDSDSDSNDKKHAAAGDAAALTLSDIYHPYDGWSAFAEQLDFVDRVNQLVERLRFVDRSQRTQHLRDEVEKWNQNAAVELGWDLTAVAGEPVYRIMRVVSEECRVFRTKARAPSLIVCEVLRDDLVAYYQDPDFTRLNKEQQQHLQQHYQTSLASIIEDGDGSLQSIDPVEPNEPAAAAAVAAPTGKAEVLKLESVSTVPATVTAAASPTLVSDTSHMSLARSSMRSKVDIAHTRRKHGLDDSSGGSGSPVAVGLDAVGDRQQESSDDSAADGRDSLEGTALGDQRCSSGEVFPIKGTFSAVAAARAVSFEGSFEATAKSLHDVEELLHDNNGKLSEASRAHAEAKAKASSIIQKSPMGKSAAVGSGSCCDDELIGRSTDEHSFMQQQQQLVTSSSLDCLNTTTTAAAATTAVPPVQSPSLHSQQHPSVAVLPVSASIPKRPSSAFLSSNRLSLNVENNSNRTAGQSKTLSSTEAAAAVSIEGGVTTPTSAEEKQLAALAENAAVKRSPLPAAKQFRRLSSSKMVDHSYAPGEHDIDNNNNNGISSSSSSSKVRKLENSGSSNCGNGELTGEDPPSPAPTISIPRKDSASNFQSAQQQSDRNVVLSTPPLSVSTAAANSSSSSSNGRDQHYTSNSPINSNSNSSRTAAGINVTRKVLSSAQRLLASGLIDANEYELLLASDQQFRNETAREEEILAQSRVEDAFGELWESKKERILGDKMYMFGCPARDEWPGWDLRSYILKTNDDLRQEVCCLQLMQICKEIFEHFGLAQSLWLQPYRIVSSGSSTGLVQVLTDAISLDALKKTAGFTNLKSYFKKTYDTSPERFATARLNFASSLAAYSLFSYLLLIKDRHNGNLLIDTEGHIIHIDFGFLLGIAPGGAFSLESAPFKLTEEMVDLLGGLDSPLFGEFVTAFTKGFIALQANAENIVSALQVLSKHCTFPCFQGRQATVIIDKLKSRFRSELSVQEAVKHCLDLITNSYCHMGTRQYDSFQWYTNGIMT